MCQCVFTLCVCEFATVSHCVSKCVSPPLALSSRRTLFARLSHRCKQQKGKGRGREREGDSWRAGASASEPRGRLFAHLVCLLLPIYLWPRLVRLRRGTSCSCSRPGFVLAITLLLLHYLSNGIFIGFHQLSLSPSLSLCVSIPFSFSPEINAAQQETKMQTQLGTGSWRQAHSLLAVPQSA